MYTLTRSAADLEFLGPDHHSYCNPSNHGRLLEPWRCRLVWKRVSTHCVRVPARVWADLHLLLAQDRLFERHCTL